MSSVNNIAPINEDYNIVKYEIYDIKQKIYTIFRWKIYLSYRGFN